MATITLQKTGEASYLTIGDKRVLFSYEMLVGVYDPAIDERFAWVTRDGAAKSKTTGKHIKEWIDSLGIDGSIVVSQENVALKVAR